DDHGLSVAALPDAAPRDGHRPALRQLARLRRPARIGLVRGRLPQELPPDEEGDARDEAGERHPEVDALAEEVVRRVDPERLLERAERRVPGDVEREERRPLEPEPAVEPEEDADADHVPDELVEE